MLLVDRCSATTSTAGSGSRARAAGAPGGQGPHLGHARACWPWSRRSATTWHRFSLDLVQRVRRRAPATPTCTPACRPSSCRRSLVFVAAAVLLIYNIRRQGWALPDTRRRDLWFLVALSAGHHLPGRRPGPQGQPGAELARARPTSSATSTPPGPPWASTTSERARSRRTTNLTAQTVSANSDTLDNVRLWDPDPITRQTFDKQQDIRSYYQFNTLGVDRYTVNGTGDPGDRRRPRDQRRPTCPPRRGSTPHLQYTHGDGMVVALANQPPVQRRPRVYAVGDVPPASPTAGCRTSPSPPSTSGSTTPATSWPTPSSPRSTTSWPTAPTSRPTTRATGACSCRTSSTGPPVRRPLRRLQPVHLQPDHHQVAASCSSASRAGSGVRRPPRSSASTPIRIPVLVNGQIDWIQDGYTTTDKYPYSQNADTSRWPPAAASTGQLQLRPQLGEGGHQRLLGQDDLLRRGPERSDHPGVRDGLPAHVHARRRR